MRMSRVSSTAQFCRSVRKSEETGETRDSRSLSRLKQRYSAFITAPDSIDFAPGSTLPLHFAYWRIPDAAAYTISPAGHENTLRLLPSLLNLTGFDENSAPTGQTFVGRRQVHSEFVFGVDMEYAPEQAEEEAGVSVFLTQVSAVAHCGHGSDLIMTVEPPY